MMTLMWWPHEDRAATEEKPMMHWVPSWAERVRALWWHSRGLRILVAVLVFSIGLWLAILYGLYLIWVQAIE